MKNMNDPRSYRGIFSRGHARYGISRAPKPGNMLNVQKAARKRLAKLQGRKFSEAPRRR